MEPTNSIMKTPVNFIINFIIFFLISVSAFSQRFGHESVAKAEIPDGKSSLHKEGLVEGVRIDSSTKSDLFYEAVDLFLRMPVIQSYLSMYMTKDLADYYGATKSGIDLSSRVSIIFRASKGKFGEGDTHFVIYLDNGDSLSISRLKESACTRLIGPGTKIKVIISVSIGRIMNPQRCALGELLQTLTHECGLHAIPVMNFISENIYNNFDAELLAQKANEAWDSGEVDVAIDGLTQDNNMDFGNPTTAYINISGQLKKCLTENDRFVFEKCEVEDMDFIAKQEFVDNSR